MPRLTDFCKSKLEKELEYAKSKKKGYLWFVELDGEIINVFIERESAQKYIWRIKKDVKPQYVLIEDLPIYTSQT